MTMHMQFDITSRGTDADGRPCEDVLWEHPYIASSAALRPAKRTGPATIPARPDRARERRQDAATAAWIAAHGTEDDAALFAKPDTPDEFVSTPTIDALAEHLCDDAWSDAIARMFDKLEADESRELVNMAGQHASSNSDIPAGKGKVRFSDSRAHEAKRARDEADKPCFVCQTVEGWTIVTYTIDVRKQRKARQSTVNRQNSRKAAEKRQIGEKPMTAAERQRRSRERKRRQQGMFATL